MGEIEREKKMGFGDALEVAIQDGVRIAREGWVENDIFVCYMAEQDLEPSKVSPRIRRFVPEGGMHVNGYFAIWIGKERIWQPGWTPTQTDLVAEDWVVVADNLVPMRPKLVLG